jgi:prepilin-type N-terminal cleavage/methylation domain-containing protein
MLRRGQLRDDSGFTLVELLVSIVILGAIMAPLTGVVIGFFKNSAATQARLNESHDAQITAAYFAQDVQALGVRDYDVTGTAYYPLLQSVEPGVAPDAGLYPCGDVGSPAAIVRLAWDEFSSSALTAHTRVHVAYVLEGTELHRLLCDASAAPTTDDVVAHNITAASVTCLTASGGTGCTGTGTDVPTAVSLHLTIRDPKSPADYAITLTGQRRQSP